MVAMKRIGEHSASANGVRSTTANPRELPLPANGDVNDSPRTLHLSIRHDPRVAPALTVVAIAMAIVSTQMAATDPTPTDRMVIRRGRSTTPRNMPAATMRFSALGPAPVREPAAEKSDRDWSADVQMSGAMRYVTSDGQAATATIHRTTNRSRSGARHILGSR